MNHDAILSLLRATDDLQNVKQSTNPVLKSRGLDFGCEFTCTIAGREVNLLIGFDKHFPLHKPDYYTVPNTALGHIPHVEKDGWICYTHDDYLAIDFKNPSGVIAASFEAVKQTLQQGLLKENEEDFLNEFEAYWRRLDDCQTVFLNIKPGTIVKKIKVAQDGKVVFAVDDTTEATNLIGRMLNGKGIAQSNAIYIPFERGSHFVPPPFNHKYSLNEIRHLLESCVSQSNKKVIVKNLADLHKRVEYVVLSQVQPNGNVAFFGFKFSKIKGGGHPLSNPSTTCRIEPLSTIRLDEEYLTKRGGNGDTFSGKKGLVIGGGSVGSYICNELVKVGLLNLTIVDKEKLEPENIYRHSCGRTYLTKNKAEALKEKMEKEYPHAIIKAVPDTIENALDKKTINPSVFDFIIVATGNVTINIFLNELLFRTCRGIPTFFAWLEPYGIGGHCLVTNLRGKGCYRCLYDNDDVINTAAFTNSIQPKPFLKTISGCGSVYTPFSSLDVAETALLTVRTVIQTLKETTSDSAIYSWKGDSSLFLAEGYQLSKRFDQTPDELENLKSAFACPTCEICRV